MFSIQVCGFLPSTHAKYFVLDAFSVKSKEFN